MKGFWQGIKGVWTTGASSCTDSSSGGGAKGSWPAKGSSSCSSPMISSSSGLGSFSAFGDSDKSTLSSSSTMRFFFLRDTMGTSSSSSSILRFCGDSDAWSSTNVGSSSGSTTSAVARAPCFEASTKASPPL